MTLLWLILGVIFASFFAIVLRGAPFVPTRTRDLSALFRLYDFKPSDVLVDLGSGDGRVLEAAAHRGIRSVGYELNPFLAFYSLLRLRRFETVSIRLEDFWRAKLPEDTAVVFVFLAGPFMGKLDTKLAGEATRLGHDIVLISYGVSVAGKTPENTQGPFVVYRYQA